MTSAATHTQTATAVTAPPSATSRAWAAGTFVFLAPKDNPHCTEAVAAYGAVDRLASQGAAVDRVLASLDLPGLERPGKLRRATLAALRASDVVYLSGGNTFHFLHHLRRSGMLEALRRFALRGGVVAGLSAGGILMTPDIGLAGYPPFDRDEDEIGLSQRDRRALGLVGFDFFPHYRRSSRLREALLRYSRRSTRPLYACRDGSGIVVEQDRFTAHGEVWLFDRGRVRRLGDPG